MAMGLFTQAVVVLLAEVPELSAVGAALEKLQPRFTAADGSGDWMGGRDCWMIRSAERPKYSRQVVLIKEPWPDHMGDPATEMALFGAWSMGFLGPFTYPRNLSRACAFTELAGSKGLADAASSHRACLLIRSSFAFGAKDNDPVIPADYDAVKDLRSITDLAMELMHALPNSLFFIPGGERLHDATSLAGELAHADERKLRPVGAWCNVRIFELDEWAPGWLMMDSIGFVQLDSKLRPPPDHEACWPRERLALDTGALWGFLLSIGDYTVGNGRSIEDGHTTDGAGIRWRAKWHENGLCDPPRDCIRWVPVECGDVPALIRGEEERKPARKRWLGWFGKKTNFKFEISEGRRFLVPRVQETACVMLALSTSAAICTNSRVGRTP